MLYREIIAVCSQIHTKQHCVNRTHNCLMLQYIKWPLVFKCLNTFSYLDAPLKVVRTESREFSQKVIFSRLSPIRLCSVTSSNLSLSVASNLDHVIQRPLADSSDVHYIPHKMFPHFTGAFFVPRALLSTTNCGLSNSSCILQEGSFPTLSYLEWRVRLTSCNNYDLLIIHQLNIFRAPLCPSSGGLDRVLLNNPLTQHVSGIIMPIFRRARSCIT